MRIWRYIAAIFLSLPCSAGIGHATHYAEVTVVATQVDEAVDWFYATGSQFDSTFWGNATEGNVRWTNSDGTVEVPFGTISFTDAGSTGTAAWFVAGTYVSASVDATYRIYFGGSASAYGVSDTYGQYNVFDANTVAVYLPGETTANLTSASYGLTAVNSPGTAASDYEGITAATYNGSTQYHYAEPTLLSNWPAASEFLYYRTTTSTEYIAAISDYGAVSPRFGAYATSTDFVGAVQGASGSVVSAVVSSGAPTSTWIYGAVNRDAAFGDTYGYSNGSSNTNATNTTGLGTNNSLSIAAVRYNSTTALYFTGNIALYTVHSADRSANYISTRYNNFDAPGTFLTHGSSVALSGGPSGHPWFYRRR